MSLPPWLVDWMEYSHHFLSLSGQWHSNDYQPDCNFSCHSHLLIIDYQPNCSCRCHHDILIIINSNYYHSNYYQPDFVHWCHSHLLIFDYQPNCGCLCHHDLLMAWNTLITSYHYLANDILMIINPTDIVDATMTCWLNWILLSLLITIWPKTSARLCFLMPLWLFDFLYQSNCGCRCHHDLLIELNNLIFSHHFSSRQC